MEGEKNRLLQPLPTVVVSVKNVSFITLVKRGITVCTYVDTYVRTKMPKSKRPKIAVQEGSDLCSMLMMSQKNIIYHGPKSSTTAIGSLFGSTTLLFPSLT